MIEALLPCVCRGNGKVHEANTYSVFLSTCIQREKGPPDEVNIPVLSQRNVDRFAVLMDIWTSEAEFLEAKLKVRKTTLPGAV